MKLIKCSECNTPLIPVRAGELTIPLHPPHTTCTKAEQYSAFALELIVRDELIMERLMKETPTITYKIEDVFTELSHSQEQLRISQEQLKISQEQLQELQQETVWQAIKRTLTKSEDKSETSTNSTTTNDNG